MKELYADIKDEIIEFINRRDTMANFDTAKESLINHLADKYGVAVEDVETIYGDAEEDDTAVEIKIGDIFENKNGIRIGVIEIEPEADYVCFKIGRNITKDKLDWAHFETREGSIEGLERCLTVNGFEKLPDVLTESVHLKEDVFFGDEFFESLIELDKPLKEYVDEDYFTACYRAEKVVNSFEKTYGREMTMRAFMKQFEDIDF